MGRGANNFCPRNSMPLMPQLMPQPEPLQDTHVDTLMNKTADTMTWQQEADFGHVTGMENKVRLGKSMCRSYTAQPSFTSPFEPRIRPQPLRNLYNTFRTIVFGMLFSPTLTD